MPTQRQLRRQLEAQMAEVVKALTAARFWHARYHEDSQQEHLQRLAAAAQERDEVIAAHEARHAAAIEQATEAHAREVSAVDAQEAQALAEARRQHEQAIKKAGARHAQQVKTLEEERDGRLAAIEVEHEQASATAERRFADDTTALETAFEQAMAAAAQQYHAAVTVVRDEITAVAAAAGLGAAPFDDAAWADLTPAGEYVPPAITRVGQLTEQGDWGALLLPAGLPIIGAGNVLLKARGVGKAAAVSALQGLMLRLLATIPPGKLRLTLVDPVGLGDNVAAFMHLADYDPELVTSKAWTEPQHIEQRLADLSEHMEMVIQKFLRNEYTSIEAYNQKAGEVAEPYRLLIVVNFPVGFTEQAARRLVSIVANGPRCGVYTLVSVDMEQPPPHGFNLADLERAATVLDWQTPQQRFAWNDPDFQSSELEVDNLPAAAGMTRVLQAVGERAKNASRVVVPFEKLLERARLSPAHWWQASTLRGIHAPLGPSGARTLQYLDLGKGTAQHVLIAGKTGSGKSTLLHTLIISLSLSYSPDELQLYLIDFKKGVEFKTYALHQLPHARVVAIESEREFGLGVIQGLDAELKRRGDLLRKHAVDGLADYREKTGEKLPRLMLIVDEFQEFFTEDDVIASQTAQILDRLVRQGRAFGIHVLLGSQTLAGAYSLARSTIDQMAVRVALQCSESDSRLILADDNPAARLLSRPGEAIYNAANGTIEGNNRFQVAWLPDEQRDAYLARLHEREYRPEVAQIVFEGNAPAEVEKNRELRDLLAAAPPGAAPRSVVAWLGDPVAIKGPTAAVFRRQSGSNLLIVGQDELAGLGMTITALLSLILQNPSGPAAPNLARCYVLDFSLADAPGADALPQLAGLCPGTVHHARRRGLAPAMNALAEELDRRLAADESAFEPIFLLIYGLQRARDLRQEDGLSMLPPLSFDDSEPAPPSPARQLQTILREGPEQGIHVMVWCDTHANLNRSMDRRAMREFDMRVVLQMGAEDSSNLIDSPAASKLGQHRAYFFSEEQGRLEKFRPYGLPPAAWLESLGVRHSSAAQAEKDEKTEANDVRLLEPTS